MGHSVPYAKAGPDLALLIAAVARNLEHQGGSS